MTTTEIISLIVAIVSLIITSVLSYILFRKTRELSTANFITKEDIFSDLLELSSTLQSICMNWGCYGVLNYSYDLDFQLNKIKAFYSSTTMSYILNCASNETAHHFCSHIHVLANEKSYNPQRIAIFSRSTIELINKLINSDFTKIIQKKTLKECLQSNTDLKNHPSGIMKISLRNIENAENKMKQQALEMLYYLKDRGIDDPYIDAYIYTFKEDEENLIKAQNKCIEVYGSCNKTIDAVLAEHKDTLKDFKPAS